MEFIEILKILAGGGGWLAILGKLLWDRRKNKLENKAKEIELKGSENQFYKEKAEMLEKELMELYPRLLESMRQIANLEDLFNDASTGSNDEVETID